MSAYDHSTRTVIDAGVDWLTCSAAGADEYKRMTFEAAQLLDVEQLRGNMLKRVSLEGYSGFSCGAIFAGARDGIALVRLSSHLAKEHWRSFYELSTNVSRLDAQVTVRYTPEVPRVAERVERDVLKRWKGTKSKLDVQLRRSRVKGSTCYIGSRASDSYKRVYDKYRESKREEYKACHRFEEEYKRKMAVVMAARLHSAEDEQSFIVDYVAQSFRRVGSTRLWATNTRPDVCPRPRPDSDARRMLQWLAAGVRPTVGRLLEAGYLFETIEALGLSKDLWTNLKD